MAKENQTEQNDQVVQLNHRIDKMVLGIKVASSVFGLCLLTFFSLSYKDIKKIVDNDFRDQIENAVKQSEENATKTSEIHKKSAEKLGQINKILADAETDRNETIKQAKVTSDKLADEYKNLLRIVRSGLKVKSYSRPLSRDRTYKIKHAEGLPVAVNVYMTSASSLQVRPINGRIVNYVKNRLIVLVEESFDAKSYDNSQEVVVLVFYK